MQYALLVYERPDAYRVSRMKQRLAISAEYVAIRHDPRVIGGAALKPVDTATTVREVDGESLITDGPLPTPKRSSAATTSSRQTTSMPPWKSRSASRRFGLGGRGRNPTRGGGAPLIEQVFRDEWGRVLA